jgi:acyl-CoA synthetase (AMP-forming)/AMP-acid ligase II/NAD(P)-dependent dehydrogenase (short-subunit alcohol dehydrogenase family)
MNVVAPERRADPIEYVSVPDFVLGDAREHEHRRALVDAATGRALSYSQLRQAIAQAAAGLGTRGVRGGDVVALCAPNSIEFVLALYAAWSIGAIVTTVNPQWTGDEISRQLAQTGARWLVTAITESEEVSGIETIPIEDFAGGLLEPDANSPVVDVGPDDVAFLPSSSGTTGLPKSVVLTHRNLVANLCQMRAVDRRGRDDVVIAALPLFHIYGLQVTLNLSLSQGATVVILPRFELAAFLSAIERYGVTRAEVVPPILLALADSQLVDHHDLSSLDVVTAAAAPLGADVARACTERLGCRVKQAFGMTELGGATHIAPDSGPSKPDSVGPPLPGVECRVVDPETETDVATGGPGELLIRSASAMRGYLNNPEATAATIDADGWVHSGDIVTVDEDGWFRIVDRIKELIKYKGYQVAPAELEDILLTHPAVTDAAVVRSPDHAAGEVPKAFIVRRAPASAEELMAWVADRVAPYKRIRRVQFTDQIPKSPSGKILRRLLADRESADGEGDLTGQVILVSGGGRGLGKLLACTLAHAGAAVALVARSHEELTATVTEIERSGGLAAAAAADLTDARATAAAVAALRDRLGPLDALINNAGINGPIGEMWALDADDWWRTLEVNLGGTFALTRLVLPQMIAAGRGRIINITSRAGVYRWPLMSAYAASKASVVKLTETLAAETKRHGVSVFSVDPGLLPIGLSEAALSGSTDLGTAEGRVFGWIRERLASGEGADPDRAARLICELAAGRGDRLSGRHLTVSADLDDLLSHIDDIEAEDLHVLRLQTSVWSQDTSMPRSSRLVAAPRS